MKIVFVGDASGTSQLRYRALQRLGHDVYLINPYDFLPKLKLAHKWSFKTGSLGLADLIAGRLFQALVGKRFELAFVDNGELLSAKAVKLLHIHARKIILYNTDNLFVARDGWRWRLLMKALPSYDLFVAPRLSNVRAAQTVGVRHAIREFMSADEESNRLWPLSRRESSPYLSEVAFVGTWMPERGPFMRHLLSRGVPLTIYGPRWEKAPEYEALKNVVLGGSLNSEQYVQALAGCRIAIAMLSKGNEDLHTTRTMEIPAIGRLLCGERTSEHLELYDEGEEAVFWDNAEECADICLELLRKPDRIEAISSAGAMRVRRNGCFNEPSLQRIITAALK